MIASVLAVAGLVVTFTDSLGSCRSRGGWPTLINADCRGAPGTTTEQWLPNAAPVYGRTVNYWDERVAGMPVGETAIVWLGGNDMVQQVDGLVWRLHAQLFADALVDIGYQRIYWLTMPRWSHHVFGAMGYRAWALGLCAALEKVACIDIYPLTTRSSFRADNLHLSRAGHRMVAEEIEEHMSCNPGILFLAYREEALCRLGPGG